MQTIEINIYKFDELSKDIQAKAVDNLRDINIDYDWWDAIYDDAFGIDTKISGFDTDRGSYCNLDFTDSAENTAKLILENHGEGCDTFKDAEQFLKEFEELNVSLDKTEDEEKIEDIEFEIEVLEKHFKNQLSESYLTILRKQYEYNYSDEAIIETIEGNDYEFLDNGELYR